MRTVEERDRWACLKNRQKVLGREGQGWLTRLTQEPKAGGGQRERAGEGGGDCGGRSQPGSLVRLVAGRTAEVTMERTCVEPRSCKARGRAESIPASVPLQAAGPPGAGPRRAACGRQEKAARKQIARKLATQMGAPGSKSRCVWGGPVCADGGESDKREAEGQS